MAQRARREIQEKAEPDKKVKMSESEKLKKLVYDCNANFLTSKNFRF
jgi:hypothetical protein